MEGAGIGVRLEMGNSSLYILGTQTGFLELIRQEAGQWMFRERFRPDKIHAVSRGVCIRYRRI
jgi:hypothetical protein